MDIETNLTKIAETGLLGIFLVMSLIVIFFLYKETKSERNLRLEDLKEYSQLDRTILNEIKNTLALIQSLLSNK